MAAAGSAQRGPEQKTGGSVHQQRRARGPHSVVHVRGRQPAEAEATQGDGAPSQEAQPGVRTKSYVRRDSALGHLLKQSIESMWAGTAHRTEPQGKHPLRTATRRPRGSEGSRATVGAKSHGAPWRVVGRKTHRPRSGPACWRSMPPQLLCCWCPAAARVRGASNRAMRVAAHHIEELDDCQHRGNRPAMGRGVVSRRNGGPAALAHAQPHLDPCLAPSRAPDAFGTILCTCDGSSGEFNAGVRHWATDAV